MAIKGGRAVDQRVSVTLFVRHGDEDRAIAFYQDALGAEVLLKHELRDGTLSGATLKIGDSIINVAGANPRRDLDPTLGGPCSPAVLGTTSTIFDLYVRDVDAAVSRAIDAGATLRNPVEDTAWGDRAGAFIDPFGHIWALSTATEEVEFSDIPARMRQLAEQRRRQQGAV
jgi:uncharacterized glyoxalase superfamily protein PhnB